MWNLDNILQSSHTWWCISCSHVWCVPEVWGGFGQTFKDSPRESSVGSFAPTCGVQLWFELFHPWEGEQPDSDDMAYRQSFGLHIFTSNNFWTAVELPVKWSDSSLRELSQETLSPWSHNRQVMPFPEEDETFQDSEKAYRTTREHEVSARLTTWSAFGLESCTILYQYLATAASIIVAPSKKCFEHQYRLLGGMSVEYVRTS